MGSGAGLPFQTLKWALFCFNAVFAVLGLAVLITSAVVLADTKTLLGDYGDFARDEIKQPAGLLVFVGLVMFVVAGVGCLAAVRESRVLVLAFTGIIGFLVVLEFSGSIAAYVYRNEVWEYGSKKMHEVVDNYWKDFYEAQAANTTAKHVVEWDNIQKGLKCCGVKGWSDWTTQNASAPEKPVGIPWSCCVPDSSGGIFCQSDSHAYKTGCLTKIGDMFTSNLGTIGGFALALLFIEIVGIASGCAFSSSVRDRLGV